MEQHLHNNTQNKPGYEESDVNTRGLFIAAFVVIIVVIVVLVSMNELFLASKESQFNKSVYTVESADLRELYARENSVLNSYLVLDKEKGIYQIPIDQAMKLEADEAFQKNLLNIVSDHAEKNK